MRKGFYVFGFSALVLSSVAIADQQGNQTNPITTRSIYLQGGAGGSTSTVESQVIDISANAVVTTTGNQSPIIASTQPAQTQRLLIRLRDPALQPKLKQLRAQMGATNKMSRAAQQQFSKTSINYRQRLQKSQSQVLDQLHRQQHLVNVHYRFTELTNTLSVTAAADSVDAIRRLPEVAAVFIDNKVSASLTDSVSLTEAPSLWAMRDLQGNAVTGKGITIAILDTGVDYTHPDLGGCVGTGCKVVAGYNFILGEDSANFMDKNGHGTHVAGIVAAKGTLTGVAPDAQLYAYKVLNDYGNGMDSSIIAALEKAVDPDGDPLTDDQIDIVNMSLGGVGVPDSPLSEAANNAMEAGTLIVVAAGNSGSNYSTIGSPGNAEEVLTVGASNNMGEIADFSSRGPIAGKKYIKPEVVAPGVEINSAAPGGGYIRKSGTSMAAPHVAGGAALIKQLKPELTASDIKALLISSAADLGKDLFAQGAGMMKLMSAATAKALVTPMLLSAGRIDISVPQFSAQVPFKVKNISRMSLPVELTAPVNLPAGAKVSPASSTQMLAVGQEFEFSLQLDVDTASLPYADSKSLYHQSVASLRIDNSSLRLPLIFSKSALLDIRFANQPYTLLIFNEDGTYFHSTSFFCDQPQSAYSVDVKPGTYQLAVSFVSDYCATTALVFKENLHVNHITQLDLSASMAVHELKLAEIISEAGTPIDVNQLGVTAKEISWAHKAASVGQFISSSGMTSNIMKVSNTSEKIAMNITALLYEFPKYDADPSTYYLIQDSVPSGVSAGKSVQLDLRESGGFNFRYADVDKLAEGVTFSIGYQQLRSLSSPHLSIGLLSTRSIAPRYKPVEVTVYSSLSTFANGESYPLVGTNLANPNDPFAWEIEHFRSGLIAFEDKESYTKLKGPLTSLQQSAYRSSNRDLVIENNGYFFSGYFIFDPITKNFVVADSANSFGSSNVQKDYEQNSFYDSMPYKQLCDGRVLKEDQTRGVYFSSTFEVGECSVLSIELEMATRFQREKNTSKVHLTIDTNVANPENHYLAESPLLEQLIFLSDGIATRLLNGNDVELRFKARAGRYGFADIPPELATIEYKLDNDINWIQLNAARSGVEYFAKLPVVSGAHKLSLRVVLHNGNGIKVEQILNSIAILGTDVPTAESLRPVFENLPNLVVEAEGLLTNYILPPVIANDKVDGKIVAEADNLGPYGVGDHVVRWSATNSIGKKASAIQGLTIRDTTPPTLDIPSDIRVSATGELTQVLLGEASAIDLVDGPLMFYISDVGPFAVGTHQITWAATDKAGNRASAIQIVTVDPVPQSSKAASSASTSSVKSGNGVSNGGGSSGGGGGGGSIGLLMLILLGMAGVCCFVRHPMTPRCLTK